MRRFTVSLSIIAPILFGLVSTIGSGVAQDATPRVMATPPAAGQMVTINGADIYYEDRGDPAGQPVLLLHGGLGNTEEWNNLSPALVDAGYRVIVMDNRGRGHSTWGDGTITYEIMAEEALGVLDHLGIDKTNLVGWSDGAIIGLELAVTHPERLNRAVIYGANFTPDGFHNPSEEDLAQMPPFEKVIEDYQRLAPEPERFDELLEVTSALYKVAPNFSEEELQSITVPVLILDGAEEEMISADQPVRMAELIPGAELILMPDVGHFAPIQQPEEFNRIVLEFLGSSTGDSTPAL